MTVSQTSILSFYQLRDEGRLSSMQSSIYSLIKKDASLCNRDIARILGMEICSVTGRVNELAAMGKIVSWAEKKDTKTNRTVKIWRAI